MPSSESKVARPFGIVDMDAEHAVLSLGADGMCRLILIGRTERGFPRRELASIPAALWKTIYASVQKELVRGMDAAEQGLKPPLFAVSSTALSPLIARELAVLLWALMEDNEGTHTDALLSGWRQLAREERWWLYARASNPAQRQGRGWRRALFHALTDPADTRTGPGFFEIMETASAKKKVYSTTQPVSYRDMLREEQVKKPRSTNKAEQPEHRKAPARRGQPTPPGKINTSRRKASS